MEARGESVVNLCYTTTYGFRRCVRHVRYACAPVRREGSLLRIPHPPLCGTWRKWRQRGETRGSDCMLALSSGMPRGSLLSTGDRAARAVCAAGAPGACGGGQGAQHLQGGGIFAAGTHPHQSALSLHHLSSTFSHDVVFLEVVVALMQLSLSLKEGEVSTVRQGWVTAVRNTGLGLAAAATVALPTFVPVANAFEAQQVYGDMARLTPGDPVKVCVCVCVCVCGPAS
jgi:hypothetical protein